MIWSFTLENADSATVGDERVEGGLDPRGVPAIQDHLDKESGQSSLGSSEGRSGMIGDYPLRWVQDWTLCPKLTKGLTQCAALDTLSILSFCQTLLWPGTQRSWMPGRRMGKQN